LGHGVGTSKKSDAQRAYQAKCPDEAEAKTVVGLRKVF